MAGESRGASGDLHLFLSAATKGFDATRGALAERLRRPGAEVKLQREFVELGETTLVELDKYIRLCDAVVHLVVDETGSSAKPAALRKLRERDPDLAGAPPELRDESRGRDRSGLVTNQSFPRLLSLSWPPLA